MKLLGLAAHSTLQNLPNELSDANKIKDYYDSLAPTYNINPETRIDKYYLEKTLNLHTVFTFRFVDETVVIKAINKVRSSTVRADGLSINVIELCWSYFILYISSCLQSSYFSTLWKRAIFLLVQKINNPTELKHLTPISILPYLSKVQMLFFVLHIV